MSRKYFSNFPITTYQPFKDDASSKVVVDVLRRFTIREAIKSNQSLFMNYQMKDHETLQDIAERMYGTPNLYWILLLSNEIEDVYSELPLSVNDFETRLNSYYPGFALFFAVREATKNFTVGETVRAAQPVTDTETGLVSLSYVSYTAVVKEWEPTLRKLIVESETNIANLTTYPSLLIEGQTSKAVATYKRRVKNTGAARFFEDSSGNEINPLPNPLDPDNYVSPLESYTESAELGDTTLVTNRMFEERLNDSRRNIIVLRPEVVSQIVREKDSIFTS